MRSDLQSLSVGDLNLSKYFIAKKPQLLTKSACRIQCDRDRPDPPQASKFTALPKIIPIDWFEPEYWNKLTVGERAEYMARGIKVALPLAEHCQTWDQCREWKRLGKAEFMQKYGNAVLAQYEMPTEEDIEQYQLLQKDDTDSDEEDDDDEMEE
jgi:hypothetical protein